MAVQVKLGGTFPQFPQRIATPDDDAVKVLALQVVQQMFHGPQQIIHSVLRIQAPDVAQDCLVHLAKAPAGFWYLHPILVRSVPDHDDSVRVPTAAPDRKSTRLNSSHRT